ncbi:DUF4145 domain-containing protein [Leptolyngbya cf. ectocarpi LEGE 11479]|uniref:DUF4145 domain-containing protein n=1 Tax=Leptolyngbya cf. ectocarpi LEGE 11479 TaxID=1828722 RepID=A0A929FB35_LEPEC|nr:DUF4145 domain-containing protein [Leptolyngbya ectocarpi]MBE9068378.1 DUF4145 domain-containing protein [Leptolyngbya cf. ectocarpi LEGE 11479]
MHAFEPRKVRTWNVWGTGNQTFQVPDHIDEVCPICLENALLKLHTNSLRSFPIHSSAPLGDEIKAIGFSGHLQCEKCSKRSSIYMHGYCAELPHLSYKYWHEMWIYPAPPNKAIDIPSDVPDKFQKDYQEAVLVLPHSPNASAALARRGLQCGVKSDNSLNQQIAQVIKSKRLSGELSEMLETVQKIGNYGAHPQLRAGEIIEVKQDEALLSLEVLYELLDFVFSRPAKKARKKAEMAKKYKLSSNSNEV